MALITSNLGLRVDGGRKSPEGHRLGAFRLICFGQGCLFHNRVNSRGDVKCLFCAYHAQRRRRRLGRHGEERGAVLSSSPQKTRPTSFVLCRISGR